MTDKKEKRQSENWFEALREDPKEIIAWCRSEIREYQNLIKLIESEKPGKGKK